MTGAVQLIPAQQLDALELDEKQQAKVAEIQKAYADEMAKSREAMIQLRQKDHDPNEDDRAKLSELRTSLIQLRTKYRDKVPEVLNDEQKKFQNPFGNRIFTRRVMIEQVQRQQNLSDEQKIC